MYSGKKLEQGNIVHASNPKAGLPLFKIEYDLNYVLDLEAEFLKEVTSLNTVRKIFFSEQTGRYIVLSHTRKR